MHPKGPLISVVSCTKHVCEQGTRDLEASVESFVFSAGTGFCSLSFIPGCATSNHSHHQQLPINAASHHRGPEVRQVIGREDCTASVSQVGLPAFDCGPQQSMLEILLVHTKWPKPREQCCKRSQASSSTFYCLYLRSKLSWVCLPPSSAWWCCLLFALSLCISHKTAHDRMLFFLNCP